MDWVTPKPDFTYEELSRLESAIEQAPSNAALQYRFGVVCRRFYLEEKALNAFEQAVLLAPDEGDYVIALVNALIKKQEFIPALNLLNTIPAEKSSSQYKLAKLKLLIVLGFMDKVMAVYRDIPTTDPEKAKALREISRLQLKTGDYDECLDMCEAQLTFTPFDTTTLAVKITALHGIGKVEELEQLLGIYGKVSEIDLGKLLRGRDLDQFNSTINQHLQEMTPFDDANTAVAGARLEQVDYSELPEIKALKLQLQDSVSDYAARLQVSGNWFAESVPAAAKLYCWGAISDKSGHRVSHYHPGGWLSGVYYSRVPEKRQNASGGFLEIGRMPKYCSNKKLPFYKLIRPEEGQLVIFPSFLFHAVVPQQHTGLRVSIAFDVSPALPFTSKYNY